MIDFAEPRTVKAWAGATADSKPPARVLFRLFVRQKGFCAGACGKQFLPGDKPQCDHIIALINGGSNFEGNLQLLCTPCHAQKTAADVAIKAKTYRVRGRHLGLVPKTRRRWGYGRGDPYRKKLSGEVVPRKLRPKDTG